MQHGKHSVDVALRLKLSKKKTLYIYIYIYSPVNSKEKYYCIL